ncbi:hypothetical protein BDW59DRAFT_36317 [Aspergillus cavernicola]|uniref:Zn(2)-C6 fungal-type domain-containing protein n=1 Tax=Aspergillus cavernicola TaxID=176166 RepID=A0ABR4HBN2_9EURO
MSLRRKSCSACFRSRRKCNLAYPTCDTCRKTKKTCQYEYHPISPPTSADPTPSETVDYTGAGPVMTDKSLATLIDAIDGSSLDYLETGAIPGLFDQYPQVPHGYPPTLMLPDTPPSLSSITRFVGSLGEVQPIQGSTQSWQWVIDQLKSYPPEFAQRAQTIFIHRELYRDEMPQPIRTAFGVSSTSCLISETNRATLFRVVDAEVLELLKPTGPTTLLDELARLQALVLYQTIRLFHGDIAQRAVAEQQQGILMTWSLKLVARSQSEVRHETAARHAWIVAECIRRTAIVVYFLYGVNSVFRDGICIGLHTLAKLPLSTALTRWDSEGDDGHYLEAGGTISYETFLALWLVSTPRKLDPFEKLLLVPCQGLDTVNIYDPAVLAGIDLV